MSKITESKPGRRRLMEDGVNIAVRLPQELVYLLDEEAKPGYRSRSAQVRKILDAHYYFEGDTNEDYNPRKSAQGEEE